MKTIGVLGGIGPQATMDLEARLHAWAQRVNPQPWGNSGYPPLIVYYHREPPIAVEADGRATHPLTPNPRLLDAARRLGQWCDFLLIGSNGVHEIQQEIESSAGKPVLSMVDTVVEEVRRRQWKRVGTLTLFGADVYRSALSRFGVDCVSVDDQLQDGLNRGALALMAGSETDEDRQAARHAVETLRRDGVDGIILGCTEFPFLVGEAATDILNPVELLAEAAVRRAMD